MNASQLLQHIAGRGFTATLDLPTALLHTGAPSSTRFILTVRDTPEQWATSYSETIGLHAYFITRRPFNVIFRVLGIRSWREYPEAYAVAGTARSILFESREHLDTKALTAAYVEHEADVTSTIPPDRLLTLNVAEVGR